MATRYDPACAEDEFEAVSRGCSLHNLLYFRSTRDIAGSPDGYDGYRPRLCENV